MSGLFAGVRAFILDLDGVLTDTAGTHRRAWKRAFDEFLRERAGPDARPFSSSDYERYVDGKPRYDGAASFLHARQIDLPRGDPTDPPDRFTVCGVGNRKDRYFNELLEQEGARRIDPSVEWVRRARIHGFPLAVVTSSRNGRKVLRAAGIEGLFDARVDGLDGAELDLPGKPHPAYFLEAARRLKVVSDAAAVFEDAEAGVEAGRRGGFRPVVGVAPIPRQDSLRRAGADLVVVNLSELPFPAPPAEARVGEDASS